MQHYRRMTRRRQKLLVVVWLQNMPDSALSKILFLTGDLLLFAVSHSPLKHILNSGNLKTPFCTYFPNVYKKAGITISSRFMHSFTERH